MFDIIRSKLGTTRLETTGRGGGGCINDGEIYNTDDGKVFIKRNGKEGARLMFDGEYESLMAILATKTVAAPKPHCVVDNPAGGAVIVMEYLDMNSLNKYSGKLGMDLARMHLHNLELENKADALVGATTETSPQYISKFGFSVSTCCGYLPQENSWEQDWLVFYARKLQQQMDMIFKEYGDREALELWSHLQLKIPQFFTGIEVKPSLLHGDLWSGNAQQTKDGPVIFDPASFYGHHEYDLAIAGMFGGFSRNFWEEYHKIIPKEKYWNERHKLYKLFHNLNHWNHFGSGYRGGSLQIMRDLCN